MKLKKIVMVTGIVLAIVIVAAFAGMAFVFMDGMSYMATGSETLSPSGAVSGHALVVYDPGITGNAKNAAVQIADDLKSKGYQVELAGVRSAAAANASGYDIIAAGGPIYAGNVSSSIGAYLKALTPQKDTKLGLFAVGSSQFYDADMASIGIEAVSLRSDSKVASCVVRGEEADKDCSDFVSALLQ